MTVMLIFLFLVQYICQNSFYNKNFDVLVCHEKETCLHEAAHKYDYENGYLTKSQEWIDAVEEYRKTAFYGYNDASEVDLKTVKTVFFPGVGRERLPEINPFTDSFWTGGWGGYSELYAWLAEHSDGDINNIPVSLREFYDMDSINETMKGLGY